MKPKEYPQEQAAQKLIIHQSSGTPAYSVCTVVTRTAEYEALQANFIAHGFSPEDTEYLSVDNSQENSMDAFVAYNAFLLAAKSPYVILCHQDVLLLEDGRAKLDALLEQLHDLDPYWGLCGNAGVRPDGVLAVHITDPYGSDRRSGGALPALAATLDENFIVVRRSANLALSRDLAGFHMYGTDLCLIANVLGWSAYVVDFHLHHKSSGNTDNTFYECKEKLGRKYERAFRPRWVLLPTLRPVFISGSPLLHRAAWLLRRMGFWPRLNRRSALQVK